MRNIRIVLMAVFMLAAAEKIFASDQTYYITVPTDKIGQFQKGKTISITSSKRLDRGAYRYFNTSGNIFTSHSKLDVRAYYIVDAKLSMGNDRFDPQYEIIRSTVSISATLQVFPPAYEGTIVLRPVRRPSNRQPANKGRTGRG